MANYIVPEFKPLYIPFDYSFLPCKEYIPPIPFEPLKTIENAENPLANLRDRAPELTSTRHYREVVFMQESNADEALSILDTDGAEAAIQYLANYDQGEGDVYKASPWGKQDATFKSGIYTLVVNFNLPYIALYAE